MLLAVDGLTVRFGGHVAVSAVDLAVPEGSVVGLIGPNGAGKTTTFNALTGLLTPSAGKVRLDGRDITGLATHKRARLGIARTFQRLEVFAGLSVEDNIRTAIETRRRWKPWSFSQRWDARGLEAELSGICDRVGLSDVRHESAGSLSTGRARLVEVGRALAIRPRLLLLDEPASGQDAAETDRFGGLVRSLADDGTGVLLVEHDMDLVMGVCNSIVVLDFGQVIAAGAPDVIQRDPAVLAAYLGSAAAQ